MIKEQDIQLPLYEAFIELLQLEKGQQHRSVEAGSYLQLIDILHSGYMLNSKEDLVFFCKKLWLKPFHRNNQTLNERILEEIINRNLEKYVVAEKSTTDTRNIKKQSSDAKATKAGQQKNPVKNTADKNDAALENSSPQAQVSTAKETTGLLRELFMNIEETESEEGKKNEAARSNDLSFTNKNYHFDYRYLPVNRRFIEQTIRSLRYRVKGIGRPVIDIAGTVEENARKGRFENWKLDEEDGFVTAWTLLIDRDGSMIAFHDFVDALTDAVGSGTLKNEGDIYYFKNVPDTTLYTNPSFTRSVAMKTLSSASPRNILVVSDAGAARSSMENRRIYNTRAMLYKLRKHRIAWLNPMPRERWENTSAAEIAKFVNMFEPGNDNGDNLGNIVQVFKSKIITVNNNRTD